MHDEVEVEGEGGHEVDQVDWTLDEALLVRVDYEADGYFDGEPDVADDLDVEEGRMRLRGHFLEDPGVDGRRVRGGEVPYDHGDVLDDWHAHVLVSFKAK